MVAHTCSFLIRRMREEDCKLKSTLSVRLSQNTERIWAVDRNRVLIGIECLCGSPEVLGQHCNGKIVCVIVGGREVAVPG